MWYYGLYIQSTYFGMYDAYSKSIEKEFTQFNVKTYVDNIDESDDGMTDTVITILSVAINEPTIQSILVNIGSSALWDAIKGLFHRLKKSNDDMESSKEISRFKVSTQLGTKKLDFIWEGDNDFMLRLMARQEFSNSMDKILHLLKKVEEENGNKLEGDKKDSEGKYIVYKYHNQDWSTS